MVNLRVVGDYHSIALHKNSEINDSCCLQTKARIEVGENSTLAYRVTVLTGAGPNGPYNALSNIYPSVKAPDIISEDVWIGVNSIILPSITVGDFLVVVTGLVMTKDVPSGVLVAGGPADVKKNLKKLRRNNN